MSKLNSIDLIVSDVPAAAEFFHDVVGMTLKEKGPRFAELTSDNLVLMLSPDAMVPMEASRGIILHFEVEDVEDALMDAKLKGAEILLGYTKTDWGTESAMIQGPEGIVIDFYKKN